MAKLMKAREGGEEGLDLREGERTEMVSARWARSERPDSLSLLLRESPDPAAAPFSRKSVTSMARSQSPSWLWLVAKPSAAGAAVRSHRSGTGEAPRAAVGATLADGLRRGATPGGGDRANSLASSIIDGCRLGLQLIRGRLGEREFLSCCGRGGGRKEEAWVGVGGAARVREGGREPGRPEGRGG